MTDWVIVIAQLTADLSDIIWGVWTIILLCGVGLLLTWKTKFVQATNFTKALKLISGGALKRDSSDEGTGDISPFQAFTTSLSATIGNGNVAGVATAIAISHFLSSPPKRRTDITRGYINFCIISSPYFILLSAIGITENMNLTIRLFPSNIND